MQILHGIAVTLTCKQISFFLDLYKYSIDTSFGELLFLIQVFIGYRPSTYS
jgi:hypothetical protein